MNDTSEPSLDPTPPATPAYVVEETFHEILPQEHLQELNEAPTEPIAHESEAISQFVELEPAEIVPTESAPEERPPEECAPTKCYPTKRYPTEDTPTEDTPTEDTPTEDTPADNTPADNTPADNTPADNTPTGSIPTGSTAIKPTVQKEESPQRPPVSWSVFLIAQGILLLVIIGGIIWLDQGRERGTPVPMIAQAPAAEKTSDLPKKEDLAALQTSLSRAQEQITTLQQQIDAQNADRTGTQARLQEMADRMALVIKQSSFVPTADAQNLTTGDAAQVAAMLPSVSPATSELILLKERNRLTDYADKAIATGARESLQSVVEAMFDPALKHLRHASEAEFRRVQAYFEISSSIDPAYKLPLQELFKDTPIRAEADLTPAQLTTLLHDAKQPWEVRLRCAYLLRASSDAGTNAALLKVIKDDPSLDVVKQAQTTFEKRVGQRFRLFDIPSIEAWWGTQNTK